MVYNSSCEKNKKASTGSQQSAKLLTTLRHKWDMTHYDLWMPFMRCYLNTHFGYLSRSVPLCHSEGADFYFSHLSMMSKNVKRGDIKLGASLWTPWKRDWTYLHQKCGYAAVPAFGCQANHYHYFSLVTWSV